MEAIYDDDRRPVRKHQNTEQSYGDGGRGTEMCGYKRNVSCKRRELGMKVGFGAAEIGNQGRYG